MKTLIVGLFLFSLLSTFVSANVLLNASATSTGCSGSQNYSKCSDEIHNSLYRSGNTTRIVAGAKITPWFSSSTDCRESSLKLCNNTASSFTGAQSYCMVTDEDSQTTVEAALGNNQTRMDQAFNFLNNSMSRSVYGTLPGWRCLVNESSSSWNCSKSGLNGNGDSASDAEARYIFALYAAANSSAFSAASQANYRALANQMSLDFARYDIRYQTTNSSFGVNISAWLAGGGNVAACGFSCTNFMYSGYPEDGAKAMYAACVNTGNLSFCAIADNITLSYLQMANWTNTTGFRVPPGLAFTIAKNANGIPIASCTNTCSPVQWDAADAPRAFAWGETCYEVMNYTTYRSPALDFMCNQYMADWNRKWLSLSFTTVPYQYYPNGTNSASSQSGYLAQGWQAQGLAYGNQSGFETSLNSAMNHYSSGSKTWDGAACFGVYNTAFVMRALDTGMGRDCGAFQGNCSFSGNAGTNTNAPVISSVAVSSITNVSATLTWSTDLFTNSSTNRGTTSALGTVSGQNDSVTSHSVTISGLLNNTLYFVNVSSCNPNGNNCSTSALPSFFTLNNSAAPGGCGTYSGNLVCSRSGCFYVDNTTCQASLSFNMATQSCTRSGCV